MSSENLKECKVCGTYTSTVFNINLSAVHICEDCATSIFIQQAAWYVKNPPKLEKNPFYIDSKKYGGGDGV